jgi:hypothetical protein
MGAIRGAGNAAGVGHRHEQLEVSQIEFQRGRLWVVYGARERKDTSSE